LSTLGVSNVVLMNSVNVNAYATTFARIGYGSLIATLSSDLVNVEISYNKPSSVSVGWLDEIELNARRELVMHGDQLFYRDINSVGLGNVSEFRLTGVSG
jgi:hypothetical protein